MNKYYVTFGVESVLRNYYLILNAESRDDVILYCRNHLMNTYCEVYNKEIWNTKYEVPMDKRYGYSLIDEFNLRPIGDGTFVIYKLDRSKLI